MNGRSKPKLLNYCIFAIMISCAFLSLIAIGKTAMAFGGPALCFAVAVLHWPDGRKPMKRRRPTLCGLLTMAIITLGVVAHVSVAVSVRRGGADLSPYFIDNDVFLVSVWLIILLVPLRRMMKPENVGAMREP